MNVTPPPKILIKKEFSAIPSPHYKQITSKNTSPPKTWADVIIASLLYEVNYSSGEAGMMVMYSYSSVICSYEL